MTYELKASDQNVTILEGAAVTGDVVFGQGASVWYNAVIRGDEGPIRIGARTNIQDNAVVHAATTLGEDCTVGHGAIVHGCTVGNNTLIGMGAIVLDGAKIGNHCLIGAGALVTGKMDAPDGSMILGSPAKVVRPLREEEIQGNRESGAHYLTLAAAYRKEHGL